jgi:hypothetical protein
VRNVSEKIRVQQQWYICASSSLSPSSGAACATAANDRGVRATISCQFNKRRIFVAEDSINVSSEKVSIQQQNLQIEESAQ